MSDQVAPNDDEQAGIAWWNSLSETARSFWLGRAAAEVGPVVNPSVADAWKTWKKLGVSSARIARVIRAVAACPDDTTFPSPFLPHRAPIMPSIETMREETNPE
jgi:hypothetical protein